MRRPKYYHVYKRGDVYRIARPGWLFWHWLELGPGDHIFRTTDRDEAMTMCKTVNDQLDAFARYEKGKWEIEGTG